MDMLVRCWDDIGARLDELGIGNIQADCTLTDESGMVEIVFDNEQDAMLFKLHYPSLEDLINDSLQERHTAGKN
jgi:hypothetical protein